MNIIPLAHQAIRKLVLIGLLFFPFALTSSYAAELVGKPAAVGGKHSAAVMSAQTSSQSHSLTAQPASAPSAPVEPSEPEPPQLAEDNSPQEDIQQAMEEMRNSFDHDAPSDFGGIALTPDTVIPIVAMLLLFGGPVLLVIVLAILHYRAKSRRQQNINMNIDKLLAAGRDIPVELLMGEDTAVKRTVKGEVTTYTTEDGTMQKGVRNIGLGIGWLLFLTIMFGIKIGSFGFIFIGLGISQVVIWKLSGTKTEFAKAQD